MKSIIATTFLTALLLLQGCTTTFGGTVLVFGFKDLILYVLIAFVFGLIVAFKSKKEKRMAAFWTWFLLSVLLTPLAGFIYIIYLFTKKKDKSEPEIPK
jgi:uncharacterized membrane protein YhdT